jgi:hypothetical protein
VPERFNQCFSWDDAEPDGFRLQEEQVLLKDWQKHANRVASNTQMVHNWVRLMAIFCQTPVNFDLNPRTDPEARQLEKSGSISHFADSP